METSLFKAGDGGRIGVAHLVFHIIAVSEGFETSDDILSLLGGHQPWVAHTGDMEAHSLLQKMLYRPEGKLIEFPPGSRPPLESLRVAPFNAQPKVEVGQTL